MSFKPDSSPTVIANEALALLPADPITSLEEPSLEAKECNRSYKPVVGLLLERFHWNLATKRQALAQITNDREEEWLYAYTKPNDMAFPVRLWPTNGSPWFGWLVQGRQYILDGRSLFMQEGSTIYSNIEAAVLEYTSFNITEADFSVMFREQVVLELAARIAMPITKDEKRSMALSQRAEYERLRAIANDRNRNHPTYGNGPTESELVRGAGVDLNYLGTGYPLDPVANPANTGG